MPPKRGRPRLTAAKPLTQCDASVEVCDLVEDECGSQLLNIGTPPYVVDIYALFTAYISASLRVERFNSYEPWSLSLFTTLWSASGVGAIFSTFSSSVDEHFAASSLVSAAWALGPAVASLPHTSPVRDTLSFSVAVFASFFTHAVLRCMLSLAPGDAMREGRLHGLPPFLIDLPAEAVAGAQEALSVVSSSSADPTRTAAAREAMVCIYLLRGEVPCGGDSEASKLLAEVYALHDANSGRGARSLSAQIGWVVSASAPNFLRSYRGARIFMSQLAQSLEE